MVIGIRSICALLLVSAAAYASDVATPDEMGELYGNTLITRTGSYTVHFYYKPDHTFSGTVPAYMFRFQGTWSEMPDGSICRIFDPPLPRTKNPDCGPLPVRRVGEEEKEPNGDAAKLVAGIR